MAVATKKRSVTKKKAATKAGLHRKKTAQRTIAESYNKHKEFEGKQYTGMQVGRSHKWYYDKGEWKEPKITPDL